jgi:CheY-like chemotaxis protein
VHHRKEQEIEHFNPRKLVAGGGDGMSLWIARCIVDLHGGTLRYFQEPTGHHHAGAAQGNNFAAAQQKKTFILELPMSRVASSKVDEAPVAPMTLDRSLTGQALLRDPGQSEDGIKASAPPAPSPPRKPSHVAARAGPPGRKASVINVVPGSRRQSVQEMPDVIGLRRSSVALFAETPVAALPRPQSLNAVPELSMKEIEPAPTASQKMPAAPRGEETIVDEKPLLLVVDDSEMTRKMLCRIVKVHGYDYDEAEDGAVAVAKVESNLASMVGRKYVGILMDFVMYVARLLIVSSMRTCFAF